MSGTPYYSVNVHPNKWKPPQEEKNHSASGPGFSKTHADVVSIAPWQHTNFIIGSVSIIGRKSWGAADPAWRNEVIYYNTHYKPLSSTLYRIVIHHTNNSDSISAVERRQKSKGYAALGYHFFIEKGGAIYEGRPLVIMGSHAGKGFFSGPGHDPDWGSIGITMQGDYHHADDMIQAAWWHSSASKKMLQSLENLVVALNSRYAINQLILHREVARQGTPTVCPGDHMAEHVTRLRKKLKLRGPAK